MSDSEPFLTADDLEGGFAVFGQHVEILRADGVAESDITPTLIKLGLARPIVVNALGKWASTEGIEHP